MSNKIKIFTGLAAIVILLAGLSLIFGTKNAKNGNGENVGEQFSFAVKNTDPFALDDNRLYSDDYRPGTTTDSGNDDKSNFTYLVGGTTATSSMGVYSERAVNVDVLGFVVASSTSFRLAICREYSHSGNDYFAEVNLTDNTNTETTFSAPRCFEFVPDHTGTTTFALPASPVTARYTRINFRATGANGGVWFQTVAKEPSN